jgi:hypothetical protein
MNVQRLAALACVFAAACSAPPATSPDFLPLTPVDSHEVHYAGQLSPEGVSFATQTPEAPQEGSRARFEVSCHVFELDRELVPSLVAADAPWLRADSVPREEAEVLFAELDGTNASTVTSMKLLQHEGQRGTLATTNQTAFVKSFELAASGAVFMADPEVGIGHEGLWMGVSVDDADASGACTLDLELRLAELQRPIQTATGRMPGTDQEMTIQLPLFATQSLTTRAGIQADQALLIGPVPAFDDENALLFLVTVEPQPEQVAVR